MCIYEMIDGSPTDLASHQANDQLGHGMGILRQGADEVLDPGWKGRSLMKLSGEDVQLSLCRNLASQQQPDEALRGRLTSTSRPFEARQLLLQVGDSVPSEADTLNYGN